MNIFSADFLIQSMQDMPMIVDRVSYLAHVNLATKMARTLQVYRGEGMDHVELANAHALLLRRIATYDSLSPPYDNE